MFRITDDPSSGSLVHCLFHLSNIKCCIRTVTNDLAQFIELFQRYNI